jgi:diphthine synthase
MLTLIGLGLNDEKDLTLRGLEAIKAADRVYLEGYTSYLNTPLKRLEDLVEKKINVLDRKEIEETPDETLLAEGEVSLIVLGDPLVATTHSDLMLRARAAGIKTRVIHNASIYSAVAETGLQIYKFGRTTTIAYPEGDYFPKSPYDVLKENKMRGLHTLCLLDVKSDVGRYMTVNEGISLLLRMESERIQSQYRESTPTVGIARLGADDAVIRYGTAGQLINEKFDGPPHTLIVPGKLHPMEEEMLEAYKAEDLITRKDNK